MAWVKLDDGMPHHPKSVAAGPQAFALDVAAICYSNRFDLDGFIADAMLPAVLPTLKQPRRYAQRLEDVGRWHRDDERAGWQIHDIDEYQPSAEAQKRERADARERMRALRANRSRSSAEHATNNGRSSQPRPAVPTEQGAAPRTQPVDNPDPTRWDHAWRIVHAHIQQHRPGDPNAPPLPEPVAAAVAQAGGMHALRSLPEQAAKFTFRDAWKETR